MKSIRLNRMVIILPILMMVFGLVGCNTVEGFGKDLQKVGGKIEKKANEVMDSDEPSGSSDY